MVDGKNRVRRGRNQPVTSTVILYLETWVLGVLTSLCGSPYSVIFCSVSWYQGLCPRVSINPTNQVNAQIYRDPKCQLGGWGRSILGQSQCKFTGEPCVKQARGLPPSPSRKALDFSSFPASQMGIPESLLSAKWSHTHSLVLSLYL